MNNEKQHEKPSVDLRVLLEENLELSRAILANTKVVRRAIRLQQVWGILKFLIIIVPTLIALWYLPPLITKYYEQYRSFLQQNSGLVDQFNQLKKQTPAKR